MEDYKIETMHDYELECLNRVRLHPSLYTGKLGNGEASDDGIYVLVKKVLDWSIGEFLKVGDKIKIELKGNTISIRDYGIGLKHDFIDENVMVMRIRAICSMDYTKCLLVPVHGLQLVNALSASFTIKTFRERKMKRADFERGKLVKEYDLVPTTERKGTYVEFTPDEEIFGQYRFRKEYIETIIRNYSDNIPGLTLNFNGKKFLIEK